MSGKSRNWRGRSAAKRSLPPDQYDIICALLAANIRFLVVGGHAFSSHAYVRATKDIDLWVDPEPANAERLWRALAEFGAPLHAHGVTPDDFKKLGEVYQLGLPPSRVDLMTSMADISFDDAWQQRVVVELGGIKDVSVIGIDHLIRAKEAANRLRDQADVADLKLAKELRK